jgi:hypothetical protein
MPVRAGPLWRPSNRARRFDMCANQPWRLIGLLILFCMTALPGRAAAAPRYYVVVRNIEEATDVKSGATDEVRQLFIAELRRHPELTLERPDGLPAGDDPEALRSVLRSKKLQALELTLRLLQSDRSLSPPEPGKHYSVLRRAIRLAVFGNTLPDKIITIGGDGSSEIAAEIGSRDNEEVESKKLFLEVTHAAITQAVDMTVAKMKLGDHPVKKKK